MKKKKGSLGFVMEVCNLVLFCYLIWKINFDNFFWNLSFLGWVIRNKDKLIFLGD